MPTVTFFHHERVDDARRTGLTVDGSRALERYVPGDEEYDPVLRWFVDVSVPATGAIETRAAAAAWLAAHADTIRAALDAAADHLHAGKDADGGRWAFPVPTPEGPVRVSVAARRQSDAARIGEHLRSLLESEWPAFLAEFSPALVGAT